MVKFIKPNLVTNIKSSLSWIGLLCLLIFALSWHSQSHYNTHVEQLFSSAKHSERVLKIPIQDFSGKTFYLDELRGKPILLHFWASWCPSCRTSMSELEELQRHYDDKLIILAVNVFEPPLDGLNYVSKNQYSLRFVHSDKLAQFFKIKLLPTKVLIDPKGKMIWANTGHVPFITHQWLNRQIDDQ